MPWYDSSFHSNKVSYWSSNSTDSLNNPYIFEHLHIPKGNTSGINDDDKSDDDELVKDLDNAMEDAVEAEANPLPVHMIIEANPCPKLFARLTVEYLFLVRLQSFATTQRTILECRLWHLLASHHPTRGTKAWRAVEVQATINEEEIWKQLQLLHVNDGNPKHFLPKVSGLLGLKLRCTSDTPLITVGYGAYCRDDYPQDSGHCAVKSSPSKSAAFIGQSYAANAKSLVRLLVHFPSATTPRATYTHMGK
jgi:hypothetical protein